MAKFNRASTRPAVSSPVKSEQRPSGRAYEGAPGYARSDARSELFLLAVANMVGENTFYEGAGDRDDRYRQLVQQVALQDPRWLLRMLIWLRKDGNMRSAPIVGACEMVKARLDAGADPVKAYENDGPDVNRAVIGAVCQRADEPGELLAYWTSTYGRAVPKPVKRGVADAVRRLYNERALLKYDTGSKGFRFGDVIDLVHPTPDPGKAWQGDLFKHALDIRHGREIETDALTDRLPMVHANHVLRWLVNHGGKPEALLDAENLRGAGMTWEDVLSLAGARLDKARLWEAIIPSMGIFALVRNLRNFDQAGVSDKVAQQVTAKLTDPEVIARSRMFPFRFWAAYKHTDSLRWAHALEQALNHSLANVPTLNGRTLILVDRSPSMFPGYVFSTPNKSDIALAEQAAVFGAALAIRAVKPTLVEFGGDSHAIPVPKGGSVLRLIEKFGRIDGTDIPSAVRKHLDGHDRVVVVTDEQTRAGWLPSNMWGHGGARETRIDDLVPKHVPVYMWNMAGYKHGAAPSGLGNRHTLGGLSDSAFRLLSVLEARTSARWPWEEKPTA